MLRSGVSRWVSCRVLGGSDDFEQEKWMLTPDQKRLNDERCAEAVQSNWIFKFKLTSSDGFMRAGAACMVRALARRLFD
jgi:hypothetical protein